MPSKEKNLKGMSLVEMIMAIGIFTMGVVGFSLLTINAFKANSFIIEEGQASFQASRAVDGVIKEIRKIRQSDSGSYPIQSGSSFDFKVFSDIDNDGVTERVHYFLEDQKFKTGITNPTGNPPTYPANDGEVRELAYGVVNSPSEPIFYYYNDNYPGDPEHNPLTVPVIPSDVRMVQVHIMINLKPNRAPEDVNIASFAELRNLNEYSL